MSCFGISVIFCRSVGISVISASLGNIVFNEKTIGNWPDLRVAFVTGFMISIFLAMMISRAVNGESKVKYCVEDGSAISFSICNSELFSIEVRQDGFVMLEWTMLIS